MIVRAAPSDHYGWILRRCQLAPTPGFRAIEALDGEGRVVAMLGYDAWTENAVQMHVAIDTPKVMAAREFTHAAFAYPFLQAKKGIVYTVTPGSNEKSLRLQRGMGFKEAWRLPDGWAPGVDLVVMVMRREECRWLGRKPVEG